MSAMIDQLKGLSYLRLIKGYLKTGRRLVELDRAYVQAEGLRLLTTYRPALLQALAALVCLLCAVILLLALLIMLLSVWLEPWAASLALLAVFAVAGLMLGGRALRALKAALAEVRQVAAKLKEDVTCFSKN